MAVVGSGGVVSTTTRSARVRAVARASSFPGRPQWSGADMEGIFLWLRAFSRSEAAAGEIVLFAVIAIAISCFFDDCDAIGDDCSRSGRIKSYGHLLALSGIFGRREC